ncbi:MAG: hypothetical protein GY795_13175 [Desulfobacterales bacterium]|nr:hypothetical protein [Desulfobacterales bacterium]
MSDHDLCYCLIMTNCVKKEKKKIGKASVVLIAIAVIATLLLTTYLVRTYRYHIVYRNELFLAKSFLTTIIDNEIPSDNWLNSLGKGLGRNPQTVFYYFKIWFEESGTSKKDIESSLAMIYPFEDKSKIRIELKYKKGKPEIVVNAYIENGERKIDAFFPLNNCLFNPDYNDDGKTDLIDAEISRRKIKKEIK